jgi:vacuolar-type H+-ATPase subunit I/STV1
MKKMIFGIFIGLILAFPLGAHAEEIVSMIGKQVQGTFPVKLHDKDLSDQAIVIDGTSYLPVRAIAEKLGLKVDFDPTKGISISDPGETPELKAQREKAKKIQDLQQQSDDLTKQIEDLYKIIEPYETIAVGADGKSVAKPKDDTYAKTKAQRDALIAQRDDIDKQLESLRNQP